MDRASVIGIVSGIVFIIISIFMGASFQINGIATFINYPSILIVIGGVAASILISYPLTSIIKAMKATKLVFNPHEIDTIAAVENIINLANLARKQGILALEEYANDIDDAFMQKGIMLIVDGADPEITRNILETELNHIENRHNNARIIWENIATLAPSWGMIGTLIGLVLMLQELDNPSAIGPKMAVALITTFYGVIIANFIANPFATKLKTYSEAEILMKEVLMEGMLAIQIGENPSIIEEKLKSYIEPTPIYNTKREQVGEI